MDLSASPPELRFCSIDRCWGIELVEEARGVPGKGRARRKGSAVKET